MASQSRRGRRSAPPVRSSTRAPPLEVPGRLQVAIASSTGTDTEVDQVDVTMPFSKTVIDHQLHRHLRSGWLDSAGPVHSGLHARRSIGLVVPVNWGRDGYRVGLPVAPGTGMIGAVCSPWPRPPRWCAILGHRSRPRGWRRPGPTGSAPG